MPGAPTGWLRLFDGEPLIAEDLLVPDLAGDRVVPELGVKVVLDAAAFARAGLSEEISTIALSCPLT